MPDRTEDAGLLLGIEGGATHTVAVLTTPALRVLRRFEAGPGNLQLLAPRQLTALLRSFDVSPRQLAAVAVGLAGARTAQDRQRIIAAARQVWPGVPCLATHDLDTALAAAADPNSEADRPARSVAQVLVLSGTGSCCYGRTPGGRTARAGGWGHLLGDRGSAYAIGIQALRTVLAAWDATARWPRLGERLLRKTLLNEPDDLIRWCAQATKKEVAELAVEVFAARQDHDLLARAVVDQAARDLAGDALSCAKRLAPTPRHVQFVFAGSTLLKQPAFARLVAAHVRRQRPGGRIVQLRREGAWGAAVLARSLVSDTHSTRNAIPPARPEPADPGRSPLDLEQLAASPTEQRHPASLHLDQLRPAAAIELMLREEARIAPAVRAEGRTLEAVLRAVVRSFRQGGRLFYIGAGTSGRLGVLDASECPPTFRTPPDQVQGIIAGGRCALAEAVEGAEDDAAAGARAVAFRGVGRRDVVLGIAASGRTPFVWGALRAAKQRGATTVLLSFNPAVKTLRGDRPRFILAPDLGPELLTGSTRLKCGTATKLILNCLTTLAMVRLGKVLGNLMVDLNPSNTKLRDRAVRIVRDLRGVDADTARRALQRHRWNVQAAVRSLRPPAARASRRR